MDDCLVKIAKKQAALFEKQIISEFVSFNNSYKSQSGFPTLELFPDTYYRQKYFEERLEYYVRSTLVNGIICPALESRGVRVYQPELPEENGCIYYSNIEYEKHAGYEFGAEYTDKKVVYRYTAISKQEAKRLLSNSENQLMVLHWVDHNQEEFNWQDVDLGDGQVLRDCYWGTFFREVFGQDEYEYYLTFITGQIIKMQEFLGVMSVSKLSPISLGFFRFSEEKELIGYIKQTKDLKAADDLVKKIHPEGQTSIPYGYRIIDEENRQEFLNLEETSKKLIFDAGLLEKYERERLYKYLLGKSDFARSFLTSEYLYKQYDCDDCFDYTAIVSGYLKSVEQLLFSVALFSIGNGNKIKYARGRNIHGKYPTQEMEKGTKVVEFTTDNLPCIDTTMGALWHYFEKYQDSLFTVDKQYMSLIIDCLDCYSAECRNNSFHKHNIDKWSRVEFIRSNTLFLYVVILAGFRLGANTGDTSKAFQAIEQERIERLYYLIREKNQTRFEFVYYGDGEDFREEVTFVPQDSLFPTYNEYGLIVSAFLMFEDVSDAHKVVVTKQLMPQEIWWVDKSGNREMIE